MEMGKRNFLPLSNKINYNDESIELNEECITMDDKYGLQASDLRKNFTYSLVRILHFLKQQMSNFYA